MKQIISFIATIFLLTACSLTEEPQSSASQNVVFGSESGLKLYSYSFYDILPDVNDAHRQDAMCDYGAVSSFSDFLRNGGYSAETSTGWDWGDLRNINYFIVNCEKSPVTETIRNNYLGLARFFRAYFYYNKVVRFGDVPWIDKPLSVDDDALYAARDSREVVMEHILEDLSYACENITTTTSDGSLVTKWVAYALKSRICLFEGSFRKYHTELGLSATANQWFTEAASAATTVMENSGHSLYTAKGSKLSYRTLFTSDAPVTAEVMLADCSSLNLSVLNDANWYWTSGTYGPRFSMIRTYINTFLNTDGTPFTSRSGYENMSFYDECQNRDNRLSQIIRTPGYQRNGKAAAPNFNGYSYTGYQPIKFCLDDAYYDDGKLNTNAIPLFRYAEVLLNYAEAKAELGTITDADWNKTIGALRSRAGITGGLSNLPTQVDSYFQSKYFPTITNPVILEIRRERSIELSLEGFRFTDLKRWKCGNLMTMRWTGIYVPGLNIAMDLDQNGTDDVIFYQGTKPTNISSTCTPVAVDAGNQQTLSEGTKGYLTWSDNDPRTWYEDGRQYYYPIPALVIVKNPKITQNPGWEQPKK